MLSVRMAALVCVLSGSCVAAAQEKVAAQEKDAFAQEQDKAPPKKTPRDDIQEYVNWLPASSETLVVLREPYTILPRDIKKKTESLSFGHWMHEVRLMRMFDNEARALCVDAKINLWIEGAARFRLPSFPEEIREIVNTTGCRNTYDGCHVVVFDDKAPLDTTALLHHLLDQVPDPESLIPAAKSHIIEGHEAIEFVATHLTESRTKGGRETPESTKKIDLAWSERFWITSPKKNVLVVATTREVLAQTLRKIETPDTKAFPASLPEWKNVDGHSPVFGMRHYMGPPEMLDMSDMRRQGKRKLSGFSFHVDPDGGAATIAFLNCNELSLRTIRASIEQYAYKRATFRSEGGSLVARIDWSKEPAEVADKVKSDLAVWLHIYIGHAFVI